MKDPTVRYAVYFTPPQTHPLNLAAARWLGRDPFTGEIHADNEAREELTAEPRRYGFHATLKAPFELSEKKTEAQLIAAVKNFAETRTAFDIPQIVVGQLGPFFALVPHSVHGPLQDFAADIVDFFDEFRAPLSDSDIARRRPQNLTPKQRDNLMLWGYPHVMEEFRFHMTLTGPTEEPDRPDIHSALNGHFSEFINRPLAITGLALFVEEQRGEPFKVHSWHSLANR
nr:DUF1045 domain-containing protein [Rhizobium sp. CG4]